MMESMDQFLTKEDLYKARSERLDAENKKLREALEFYADKDAWQGGKENRCPSMVFGEDIGDDFCGGEVARKALKEIE
jgi:hypothetical protein